MVARRVPCIIVVPKLAVESSWNTDFKYWVADDCVKKYYFGDELE
jgi:hypothetical protein